MKLRRIQDQVSGWVTKEALAQPLSPEQQKALGDIGVVSVPDARDKYPKGNKGGRKGSYGYKDIIKEIGVEDLFQTDDPRLRTWIRLQSDKIAIIDGKEYVVWDTKKPTKTKDGFILAIGPLVRNEEGKIDADKSSFQSQAFSWNDYADKIQMAPDIIQKNLGQVNKEIDNYNKFVEKVLQRAEEGKGGANVTVLPLQIKHAESEIIRRLEILKSQKESIISGEEQAKEQAGASQQALDQTYEAVQGGQDISPQDYAILLLERKFHSVPSLEELKQSIVNEKMPFDEETNNLLKQFIVAVVDWQIKERQAEEANKQQEQIERVERMEEEDLPEMKQLFLQKVAPIEKLKGTYQKAKQYYSPEAFLTSGYMTIENVDRDYSELSSVLGSLQQARETIIELPTKTNEFVTGDGAYRLQEISNFINNADIFLKRYKENPFTETENGLEINPKLLGNSSQLGNALIAVTLRQIIISVQNEIDRIKEGKAPSTEERVEMVKKPVEEVKEVQEVKEPVSAKTKNSILRMSELLWDSFEDKMRLK